MENLLTPEQVCELLGIDNTQLQYLRRTGSGPTPLMLGYRTVRYRRHDVSVYLHSLAENALEAEVSKLKQRVCEVEAENAQLRENHGGEISEN